MYEFNGKLAVITAASGVLGSEVAGLFTLAGCLFFLAGRSRSKRERAPDN